MSSNVIEATFDYTSFDKPYAIAANGWRAEINYDANRSRYLRKDINLNNSSETKVTHYLGSVEYIYETARPVKAKRYIGNLVITIDDETISRQNWSFSYLLKDHIGSTHTIANRFGYVISQMSFNAWGQRRHLPSAGNNGVIPINLVWNFNALGGLRDDIEATTNRGFTGHEHFDQVGIIHMNGRIYDSTIGRFLQADPIIQDPYNTQSLNRYSYVMNNPLSYTDPTGYSRLRKGVIFNTVLSVVLTIFLPGSTAIFGSSVQAGATLFSAAATGAVVGAINTGNLKGAVKGGIFASITFGIGHKFKGFDGVAGIGEDFSRSRIFAHALVSGVSAEVDGGRFGHGFAAAVLSQNFGKNNFFQKGGSAGRIASNAILQGTISQATGGKFANGAISAAFRVAFNDVLGTRKTVETITSNKGESEQDFLKRVGKRTFSLSKKNSVEHCGNLCTMMDANGNLSLSIEIFTDNNPIACGIDTNSCSVGFSPSSIGIHSHVRKFPLTDELRKFDSRFNKMPSRMTQARGEIDRFSKPDLSFVQKTGFDLYLSDSKGLLHLPANAKSRDDTVRIK